MIKGNLFYSNRRQMRMILVMIVYKFELLNQKINVNEIFETDEINELFNYKNVFKNSKNIINEQIKIWQIIEKNYDIFKKIIIKFVREDWTWKRISPITRSILLCASAELWKIDVGIVSNEYVEISKDFMPDHDDYKFINFVIDKIGKIYEEYKERTN